MSVAIPLPRTPEPFFQQRTVLGGRELVLAFSWNDRAERWFLDISDANNVPLLCGLKLLPGLPLTFKSRNPGLPAGNLFWVGAIPTLATLGDGSGSLMYLETP